MKGLVLSALTLLSTAVATVVRPMTFADQVRQAQVIVQARVTAVNEQDRDGARWTVYRLAVSETLTGNAEQLPRSGDGPGLWVMTGLDDAPTLKVGDEAVLLLLTGTFDSPVVGFNQGVYLIREGRVAAEGNPDVATFKRNVLTLLGAR